MYHYNSSFKASSSSQPTSGSFLSSSATSTTTSARFLSGRPVRVYAAKADGISKEKAAAAEEPFTKAKVDALIMTQIADKAPGFTGITPQY